MVISCSAYGCTNRQNKGSNLSFHRFPTNNPILLKKWIIATKRGNWQPSERSFLCGDHFTDDCYKSSAKHFLKDDAVPSLFNFTARFKKQNRNKILMKKEKSQVCELHFRESDFITETSAYDTKTKQTISVPLLVKRLKSTVVPSVFPNYPIRNLCTVEKLIRFSESRKDTNKMSDSSEETDANVNFESHSELYPMTSFYFERLDVEAKEKYLDKLTFNGIVLPDPLDSELRLRLFRPRTFKISPNITFGDIYIFLVETENVYSREDFKSYKNLDCYKLILRGKVQDILAYKCGDSKMCILTCDIQDSENITKLHRSWSVVSCDGVIQSGHCTCMKGFGKVCSHVSALLLSLEIAVRKDITNHSRTEHSEEISEKSNCIPISGDSGQNIMSSTFTPSPPTMPSSENYKKFLTEIKKIVPNAAIFTLVSDSDFSDSDEDDRNNSNNDVLSNMHKITVLNHAK